MARGKMKLLSQARAAERVAQARRQQGHSANEQKKAAQVALAIHCEVCRAQMPDCKTYRQHFENKHPKKELPYQLKDVIL